MARRRNKPQEGASVGVQPVAPQFIYEATLGANGAFNPIYLTPCPAATPSCPAGGFVKNSNIFNFFQAATNDADGVRLDSGNTDWTISGNSFHQTTSHPATGGTTARGIFLNNTSGNNFVISNNFRIRGYYLIAQSLDRSDVALLRHSAFRDDRFRAFSGICKHFGEHLLCLFVIDFPIVD